MRIAFLGTPEFAIPSLSALIQSGHSLCVFTQPDRPVGRKAVLTPPPVKLVAEQHGIPVFQFEKIRSEEGCKTMEAYAPDLCVTAAFGQLLSRRNLAIPKFGTINVHGSLLPKYRGASPIQSAIINGETVTGVTTMMTEIGMDTGDILLQTETEIDPDETYGQLSERLSKIGAELLIETLSRLSSGTLARTAQDPEKATVCHMLSKECGHIDFSKSALQVHNLVRGTNPWPTASALLDGEILKIWVTRLSDLTCEAVPGTLVLEGEKLFVQCSDGLLEILSLQMSGKKRMESEQFLRGYSVAGKILC